jgi:hypothetical protein
MIKVERGAAVPFRKDAVPFRKDAVPFRKDKDDVCRASERDLN